MGKCRFSVILLLCINSLGHSTLDAKGGRLDSTASILRIRPLCSGRRSADTIILNSTLRLLCGGSDGEGSDDGNELDDDENKGFLENFQDKKEALIEADGEVEMDIEAELASEQPTSLLVDGTPEISDKETFQEDKHIPDAPCNSSTKEEEEENIINLVGLSKYSYIHDNETSLISSISADDEHTPSADTTFIVHRERSNISTTSNFESIDDKEEEWFFNNQIMEIVEDEYGNVINNIKEEIDENATTVGNIAVHRDSKNQGSYDNQGNGDLGLDNNTEGTSSASIQCTELSSFQDIQQDFKENNHSFTTEVAKNIDEQPSSQMSTITNDMRVILRSLSYKNYEIDVMKPNIAVTVARLRLHRPFNGMPKNWSTVASSLLSSELAKKETLKDDDSGAKTKTKENVRQQVEKIVKQILLPTVGIIFTLAFYSLAQNKYQRSNPRSNLKKAGKVGTDDCALPANTTTINGIIIDNGGNVLLRATPAEGLQLRQLTDNSSTRLDKNNDDVLHDESWFDKLVEGTWFGKLISNVSKRVEKNIRSFGTK
jgi:hypothetical protein